MNRAERRKLQKQGIDHTTIKQAQDAATRQAVNTTTNYAVACALLVLRDEFGFGTTRGQRFTQAYSQMFADVTEGRLKFEDVLGTIRDEMGIQIEVK